MKCKGITVTLQSLELFGVDLCALITVLVAVLQFWFLAAGIRSLVAPYSACN